MPNFVFSTVSDELSEFAVRLVKYYRGRAYRVSIEKGELGYPSIPTMCAKRNRSTVIVEVGRKVISEKMDGWINYGRSCNKEIRVVFATDIQITQAEHKYLVKQGIGLIFADVNDVISSLDAHDLSINIQLPELRSLPTPTKKRLLAVYEKKERGLWKEAFEEGCKALEMAAAEYLWAFSGSGRIKVMRKNGPVTLTKGVIQRFTMGQMADNFSLIVSPTKLDTQIEISLRKVSDDRNNIIHRSNKSSTENRLRKNAGQHLYIIIDILKQIDVAL